jgi:hypothetical protein
MPVKKQLRFLAIVAIGVSLNACTTLGPDYEEPEVSWLDTWETDLYGRVVAPDGRGVGYPVLVCAQAQCKPVDVFLVDVTHRYWCSCKNIWFESQ